MPRKFEDKELNDLRRICEIFADHDQKTRDRMLKFVNQSSLFGNKEV